MSYQPLTITEFKDGLVRDREPYIVEDDANPFLLNAYQWRKRLFKKGGQISFGHLGVHDQTVPAPGAGVLTYAPIEAGSLTFTDGALNTFHDVPISAVNGSFLGVPGSTINYITGVYAGLSAGTINYTTLPNQYSPCMGILNQEQNAINNESAIAFDRKFAYRVLPTGFWNALELYAGGVNTIQWTGSDIDFFNGCNYKGSLFVTNGTPGLHGLVNATTAGDGIRYFYGNGWVNFNPPLDAGPAPFLLGCKFILPFKNRLLVFNTYEGPTFAASVHYQNRIRWCGQTTPYYDGTFIPANETALIDTWYEQLSDRGGFKDIPTQEAITGVAYLKDVILIYCERSTWILLESGDITNPFQIQKHNSDFGSESPQSIIQFDEAALCVGNTGIFEASISGVDRIDRKIPDQVFTIANDNGGAARVFGSRVYYPEMAIWAFRENDNSQALPQQQPKRFPNYELIYNYLEQSWSVFKNSYTAFGFYQNEDVSLFFPNIFPQASALLLGGNQQGFMFLVREMGDNVYMRNAQSLYIEAINPLPVSIFHVVNHNLDQGQYIQITNVFGDLATITTLNNKIFVVAGVLSTDDFILSDSTGAPVGITAYYGGAKVSLVDQIEIQTKTFNPFLADGKGVRLGYADFLAYISPTQQIEVDVYVDQKIPSTTIPQTFVSFTLTGDVNSIEKWYRAYPQCLGQFITILIRHPDAYLFTATGGVPNSAAKLIISGLQLWFAPSGRLLR